MRAAIYTRQSQDRDGTGLAVSRQCAECERLCDARGYEIVARESDNDASGYSRKARPGYDRIIELMKSGAIDVVVVWAVDRLTRRLADLSALIDLCEETGVRIATVSGDLDLSTGPGKLMARILGSIAQGEVETKSGRQKLANQQAAEKGKARKGSPLPFGWTADRITADGAEAGAIRDACRALLAGGTITGVVREWEKRGLRPHQAPYGPLVEHPWTTTSVRAILRNPRNAGIAVYRGTEVGRGEWEPVVSEWTFRAVDALLADTSRKPTQGVRTLLGCLALCRCGNMVGGSRGANGQPSYRCHMPTRNGRLGPHVFSRRGPIDDYVGRVAVERLSRMDAADLVPDRDAKAKAEVTALRDETNAIRAKLARLGALFIDGAITEADLTGGRAAGEKRLAEIDAKLAGFGRTSTLAEFAGQNAQEVWDRLSVDRRRAVIATLMTVTLHPAGRGARTFDPDTVQIEWRR